MPYTLDVYDSTQPTQTDEGATLGGEVRAIKALAFGSRSVITGNVAADQSSNGLVYKHTEATARDFSLPADTAVSPAFRKGGGFRIYNLAGAGIITIIKNGTVTIEKLGAGSVTSISLAAGGYADCVYVDTDHWVVHGSGLT